MKQLFHRGKRIRPTDKDLVFHTALAALFPVFLLVVLLFHTGQIAGTNWQEVSLSQIVQDVNIPYLLFSMGVAGLVCLTAVLLFWRYRRDEVKQLIHRQKLARMVLENKWYESEQRKEDAFFKDLSSSRSKETITYFPKMEDERKDYLKALSRQCKRETLFCDMDDYTVNLFSSEDTYPSYFHTFEMDGFTVRIENSLLAEALENLDGKKRDVILRYYFLGFDDTEISKILEVNRSTIQRRRHAGLEFIKKFMEDKA